MNLPANTAIQYKYIRKYQSSVTWESDPNMQITTRPLIAISFSGPNRRRPLKGHTFHNRQILTMMGMS